MHKYMIIGPQGCGKGTQSTLLCDDFDLVHISIGEIFRWHMKHHTKLAARIRRIMDKGNLVPDEIVEQVVSARLEQHDWNYGFVLDGFPRTLQQAQYLFENWNLDAAIYLDVPDEVVYQRVMHRAKVGEGRGFTKRNDDNPEALAVRLAEYKEKTAPLLHLFEDKGMLLKINGDQPIETVYDDVLAALQLPKEPKDSPVSAGARPPPRRPTRYDRTLDLNAALINVSLLWLMTTPHEFAHAWVALKLGDDTPLREGRVTLNPLAHVDWIGTVLLPAVMSALGAGFLGWGKPVNTNPSRLRGGRNGLVMVALAGPASNIIFAVILAALAGATTGAVSSYFSQGVWLSLYLALFNLVPVPPLDGSKLLLAARLPPIVYRELAHFGLLVLLALMVSTNFGYWMAGTAYDGASLLLGIFS